MKINQMWAMFDGDGRLFRWNVRDTRREVIEHVEKSYGLKWRHLYKQCGYRIKKVVILREEDFEAAREEVLEFMIETYNDLASWDCDLPDEDEVRQSYKERFGS